MRQIPGGQDRESGVNFRLLLSIFTALPFLFLSYFLLCSLCLKGHLLVCHSEICKGSSLNGHLSEKVTVPPNSSSRSHFQHACGRWLTRRSLLSVGLSVSRVGRGLATYTIVCLRCLCLATHTNCMSSGHMCCFIFRE